jgi:predicted nucleotidyltransferase
MTGLEQALVRLARMLSAHGIPYMIIGGIANAIWGEPRSTLDIDATVWVEDERIGDIVSLLAGSFRPIPDNPQQFIRETRILPLETEAGLRIDLVFGLLQYEQEAIERAVEITVAGAKVRFCAPEDLILHKIISERSRDLEDARKVVRRRLKSLDLAYLEPRIHELSRTLERPEILRIWERWKEGAGRG